MIARLIEYVARLTPENVVKLGVEDVALCSTWIKVSGQEGDASGLSGRVREAVGHWLHGACPPPQDTEGRRHQPLLRALLGEIQRVKIGGVSRVHLEFLCTVVEIIEQSADPSAFRRVVEILTPYSRAIAIRVESLPATNDLSPLFEGLCIATAKEMRAAEPRLVKVFAGVEMSVRGPVFTDPGHLKILGDVPEDCMVVVEKGSCNVTGYVMGRVAVKAHCEVRENIAGVVIARDGDIRGRNLLGNAFVVSKAGRVCLRGAQEPRLAFAGTEARVAGGTMMGRFVAPRIVIEGETNGGEFHVTDLLTAERFRHSEGRPVSIVLRREISCEDYGEYLEPESRRLVGSVRRLRQRLRNLRRMVQLAQSEMNQWAEGGVAFLLGGEKTRAMIDEIETAQRRQAFIDRVLAGFQTLSVTAEDQLAAMERSPSAEAEQTLSPEEAEESLSDLEWELNQIAAEGKVDKDLIEEHREIVSTKEKLKRNVSDKKIPSTLYLRLREKAALWAEERSKLAETIRSKEEELKKLVSRSEVLAQSSPGVSKSDLLTQLLSAAKKRPANDVLAARVTTPFMRVVQRQQDGYVRRLEEHKAHVQEVERELNAVVQRLRTDFLLMSIKDAHEEEAKARVAGRFSAGVRILAKQVTLAEEEVSPHAVFRTRDSGAKVCTYIREMQGVVEGE